VQVSPPTLGAPDYLDFWFLESGTVTWSGPFTMFADGNLIVAPTGF